MFVYGVIGSEGYFQISVLEQFCDVHGLSSYVRKGAPFSWLLCLQAD
jgi:hypothetical protein